MYLNNYKHSGDHSSVAEELLSEIPQLEQKCRAVEEAVKGNYFTLKEALSAYKVSEIEYLPYLLLKNNKKLKRYKKQDQAFEAISVVFSIFDASINTFDEAGKSAMRKLKRISKSASPDKKIFI